MSPRWRPGPPAEEAGTAPRRDRCRPQADVVQSKKPVGQSHARWRRLRSRGQQDLRRRPGQPIRRGRLADVPVGVVDIPLVPADFVDLGAAGEDAGARVDRRGRKDVTADTVRRSAAKIRRARGWNEGDVLAAGQTPTDVDAAPRHREGRADLRVRGARHAHGPRLAAQVQNEVVSSVRAPGGRRDVHRDARPDVPRRRRARETRRLATTPSRRDRRLRRSRSSPPVASAESEPRRTTRRPRQRRRACPPRRRPPRPGGCTRLRPRPVRTSPRAP